MFFYAFLFSPVYVFFYVLPIFISFFFKFEFVNLNTLCAALTFLSFDAKINFLFFLFFYFSAFLFFQKSLASPWWIFLCLSSFETATVAFEAAPLVNEALWNGLLFIHPLAIFFSSFFFFFFFGLVYYDFFQFKDFFLFKHFLARFFFLTATLAVSLGAWWAQHEMNWGGWWSWDPVELESFFFFMFSARVLHSYFNFNTTANALWLFFFFFIGVRFSFFTSVHSFIGESGIFPALTFLSSLSFFSFFFNLLKTSRRPSLVLLFFFFFISIALSLDFFLIFIGIFLMYFGLLQRVQTIVMPVFVFPLDFLFLRATSFLHFFTFFFFFFLFFFKPLFFFFSSASSTLIFFDLFFTLSDRCFFGSAYGSYNFFSYSSLFVESVSLVYSFCSPLFQPFAHLGNFSSEFLQQQLYIYGWQPLSKVCALYLISTLYSFTFFIFLCLKKKNSSL